jgi:hypothetical protein
MLIADTVRAVEQDGPLADDAEMREAFAKANGREERLLERARLLARRLSLENELMRWREAAWAVWLALALLAFLAAYGTALTIVGGGRTVNAVTAFFALLAMPTLTLAIWIAAAFSGGGAGLFGHLSFGNILLRLLARVPGEGRLHAPTMARAAHGLLRRARLLPWAFGVVSHAVWAAAFVLILAALWFAFSFQQYRLTWETTILDADFFVRFVTFTGALPHWLGFPLPNATTLLDPGSPAGDHRAWAWWLIGCAFVYGLLPRVVLGLVCWAAWRRGVRRLHLDTADPYYRKLLTRFEALEQSRVEDPERRAPAHDAPVSVATGQTSTRHAVVGFELPSELAWPPQALAHAECVERIAGAGNERRTLLDRLFRLRPSSLLVVCHAASSPDRGTARFLAEAARQARRTALLLLASDDVAETGEGARRWQAWLEPAGLQQLVCFTSLAEAAAWMEDSHG